MVVKRKKVSLKEIEEVEEFRRQLRERRPIFLDSTNPTAKEKIAYKDWIDHCYCAWQTFLDKRLSPEELEAKYKRSPEVDKELEEIEIQLQQSMEQMRKLQRKENPQEFFAVETRTWQLLDQLYDVMEARGSPADKQKARAYKQAGRQFTNKLAH